VTLAERSNPRLVKSHTPDVHAKTIRHRGTICLRSGSLC
jgi:hypothetical protein